MFFAGRVLLWCKLANLHGSPSDSAEILVALTKANTLQFDHFSNTC